MKYDTTMCFFIEEGETWVGIGVKVKALFLNKLIYDWYVSDELSGILKKLSLEKYHPIFEEQEVGAVTVLR